MNRLGRELRLCPAKRPGVVFAVVSLVLGGLITLLLVALITGSASSSSRDIGVVSVVAAIFLGVGVLLLVSRARKLKRALVYRVFDTGVVRETSSGREELPFADLARLEARNTRINNGPSYMDIRLVSHRGTEMRLAAHAIDNVDESLVRLLEQYGGRRAEPLTT